MSLHPYIAAFLIAAILNPFCCCFSKPVEQERDTVVSCPHCPPPADPGEELPNAPCSCISAKDFTDSEREFKLPATDPLVLPEESWQVVNEALPNKGWTTMAATAPALPPAPPIRVRFCTYLL